MEDIKVLIIDDEQINCDFFEVMLSHLGFQVFSETSGESSLTRINDLTPDIILIDLNLSTMSGMDIIRSIKKDEKYTQFRSIPIILFSSNDDSDEKVEGFELGIDDYITKPFSFAEVLARIRGILKQRELYKQISGNRGSSLSNKLSDIPLSEIKDSLKNIEHGFEKVANNETLSSDEIKNFIEISQSLLSHIEKMEKIISDIDHNTGEKSELQTKLSNMDNKFKKHMQEMNNANK